MDPALALAETTLLRGRDSALRRQEGQTLLAPGLAPALTGEGVPTSVAEPFRWSSQACRSATELMHSLQGGGGASVGLGPLPIPLLKTRHDFFESLHTTIHSVSLVVQARRVVAALEINEAQLREDLAIPADGEALDAFVAGDSWVRAVAVGGQLQAVYTLYAQSEAQAREVSSALDVLVQAGAVSLGPSFQRQLKEVANQTKVNARFEGAIAGLAQPPALDESTIEGFARAFGTLELDQPQVLSLLTSGYEAVPALREVFQPVARNRALLCGDGFRPGLLRHRTRLQEIENQCRWVEGTCGTYGLEPDPSLERERAQLQRQIRSIDALCVQFNGSPSTPLEPPAPEAFAARSPHLQVSLRDGERMGGEGGVEFRYPDREGAIRRRRRLVAVRLRAGSRIDQIRLRYRQEPSSQLDGEFEEVHGGEGGSDRGTLELGPGVTLSRIEAVTGTRVDKLRLTAKDGQSLGGGGNAGNRPLEWSPTAQEVVLGFSGRCKAELDGLWPVIATFGPLLWESVTGEEDP
ncbi:MAG: jacalin-like lectin [Cyanobium sp.]